VKPLDGTVTGRKEKASHPSCFPITRAQRKHSCIGVKVSCANQPQTIATYCDPAQYLDTRQYNPGLFSQDKSTVTNWKLLNHRDGVNICDTPHESNHLPRTCFNKEALSNLYISPTTCHPQRRPHPLGSNDKSKPVV
jgi:hypothetical protein